MSRPAGFGGLSDFRPGNVEVFGDDVRNYAFSNVFAVAGSSAPYEKVAVAQSEQYVVEVLGATGTSPWYVARHDEFALVMDGRTRVELRRPGADRPVPEADGSHLLDGDPTGELMGTIVAGTGHLALLPAGAAYRFEAVEEGVLLLQTVAGPQTIFKWAEICRVD